MQRPSVLTASPRIRSLPFGKVGPAGAAFGFFFEERLAMFPRSMCAGGDLRQLVWPRQCQRSYFHRRWPSVALGYLEALWIAPGGGLPTCPLRLDSGRASERGSLA